VPRADMPNMPTIAWDAGNRIEVLTFDMAGESFAIEASLVREILDRIPETPVPGAAAMVAGVVNFRGKVIPIADLHLAFSLVAGGNARDTRIIVIEIDMDGEDCLVGLKADKVYEVTALERAATEAAPRVGMRWRQDYIRCLAKRGGDFIVVPDLQKIFKSECFF
jgi:purine-binding chemotaxis protein CheW